VLDCQTRIVNIGLRAAQRSSRKTSCHQDFQIRTLDRVAQGDFIRRPIIYQLLFRSGGCCRHVGVWRRFLLPLKRAKELKRLLDGELRSFFGNKMSASLDCTALYVVGNILPGGHDVAQKRLAAPS
jgi:hypothetical protein